MRIKSHIFVIFSLLACISSTNDIINVFVRAVNIYKDNMFGIQHL